MKSCYLEGYEHPDFLSPIKEKFQICNQAENTYFRKSYYLPFPKVHIFIEYVKITLLLDLVIPIHIVFSLLKICFAHFFSTSFIDKDTVELSFRLIIPSQVMCLFQITRTYLDLNR